MWEQPMLMTDEWKRNCGVDIPWDIISLKKEENPARCNSMDELEGH